MNLDQLIRHIDRAKVPGHAEVSSTTTVLNGLPVRALIFSWGDTEAEIDYSVTVYLDGPREGEYAKKAEISED